MFYNTTHETTKKLMTWRRSAHNQAARILEHFEHNPGGNFTPSEVLQFVFEGTCPITSVRRAMTNLTADGKLQKTTIQRDGPYGRPEYAWRLATGQGELF